MNYRERMHLLREKKLKDTLEKRKQKGYMDLDDNGGVGVPKDFSFTPVSNSSDGGFYGATGFSVNMARLTDAHPVYVDPLEILAGRRMVMLLDYQGGWPGKWPEHLMPYDELKEELRKYDIISGIGSNQHYACDYHIGISLGYRGLIEKIRYYREKNGEEKQEFYDAHERVLRALLRLIERHIDDISLKISVEEDEEIRENLEEMLACNENILFNPPRTFLEVCQWLGWFYQVSWMYNREGAGMQIDQFLYPFYKKDKEEGILDDEKATFILANLLLLNPNYYQLSGPDEDGNDMTNELSFLVLEAAHWLNSSANITIRIHDKIDEELFKKGVEYLFKDGNGWPRFSGNKGLMNYARNENMTKKMAAERIAVGCNWMALPGREYPLNDCVKINVAKVFDVAYHEMMEKNEYSLDILWKKFVFHLERAVDVTARGVNFHLDHMHRHMPELFGNLLMHNAIEQGEDMTLSAEFINIGIDGAGIAVVADSFAALEQRAVNEQCLSWEEIYCAVCADFEGENERIQKILDCSEKYCQGRSQGDKWADKINKEFARQIKSYQMPGKRNLIPGWFSWANTIGLGKSVGATPNGRKSGAPINHGANPNAGFRKDGAATAMSNGIAMVQPGFGNPAPFQLELDPGIGVQDGGVERVMDLIRGHFEKGGTLINVNIVDKEKILAAHQNPELYPELVVRVTGFTSYFITLSPEFRKLVVDRIIDTI